MAGDSLFGSEPGKLKRLAALGFEGLDASVPAQSASAGPANPFEEASGDWIGPYKLLSVLGEGGMGMVYLADQARPVRRVVALKIIKPGMDSKRVLARFEAEQQALARMDHPYVAQVYDAGLAPSGRPYFVMEHVQGLPLTEHCDKYRLTIEQRLQLFLHVCEAVQHAHQKGIIHRDIKPSNILVMIQDHETIPKVIDFGVARAISQSSMERTLYTEQGQLIGTPEYMSPEQMDLDIHDIDTRTDVYSLGVLLYELLAGMLPFDRQIFREGGIEHLRKVICTRDPKTPSTRLSKTSLEETTPLAEKRRSEVRTLQRKLRGDLDWITLKALEKDRTRRYGTVEALAADIRRYIDHEPVTAAPPGALYRGRKFARRHWQILVALVLASLVLIAGVLSAVLYVRATRERFHAQALEHQRLLDDAKRLSGREALTSIDPLLDSPYVGREAKLAHAQILLRQKELAAAAAELETLLDKQDEIAGQAHFFLASIYDRGDPWTPGKTEEYRAKWKFHSEQAQKLIQGTAQYRFLQAKAIPDAREKLRLLGEALRIDGNHYASLRDRAYIYYAQGDYDKMILDTISMKTVRPKDPQGYLLCAIALRELGRPKEAISYHNDAVSLAPQDATLYDERRETYMRMGEPSPALVDAERCAELEPNNLSYQARVFMTLVALGRYEQASQQYERVMRRPWANPEYSPWAWTTGTWSPKDWFRFYLSRYVNDALSQNQPLQLPPGEPQNLGFWAMREAEDYFNRLGSHAKRVITLGFCPSWSPDGTKIAYTQGMLYTSAVAVLDLTNNKTEILTMPGKDPAWSPNGRYIAFVRDRQTLSPDFVGGWSDTMERIRVGGVPDMAGDIWLIELATHRMQYVAPEGQWPLWSGDSKHLYYLSGLTYYSVTIEQDPPAIHRQFEVSSPFPEISSDERFIADSQFRQFEIREAQSHRQVATWLAPPFPSRGLFHGWRSDDGREVCICGRHGSSLGTWILDTGTGAAMRMIDGPTTQARWSPDGSKMALALGQPYWEIWVAQLDPNQPAVETFRAPRTVVEHCREQIAYYSRGVAADPNCLDAHLRRTEAALWIQDANALQYLEELENAFRRCPYHAGGCNARAQAILSSPPILRNRLRPLAMLLARMAAEKRGDLAGSCRYDQATAGYTIASIGADIWDTYDDFHFAYKTLHGDGSITTRIDSIENVTEWTKAGVMIRSTLEPNCPNTMLLVTPSGRLSFQHRPLEGATTFCIYTAPGTITLPHWIRLIREGNRFIAQHSSDGLVWQDVLDASDKPVEIEVPMDEGVYIGLAVTSHDSTKTAEARISHVTTTSNVSPSGPFTDSQDILLQTAPPSTTYSRKQGSALRARGGIWSLHRYL